MENERRYQHVLIARNQLLSLLRGDAVLAGLPDDATIVDWREDWQRDALLIRVHHPSFPPVGEGHAIRLNMDCSFRVVERVAINRVAGGPAEAILNQLKAITDRGAIAAVVDYWEIQ